MNKSKFLTIALEAIKKAEDIIMHYYSGEIRATLKEDQSPVTIADQEAERIIIQTIKNAFPDHSFLGEESEKMSQESDYLWIIDPIDGTKNYLRKVPLFGTQLALMYKGEIILGISNAPALHELMYAEKGTGTYLNDTRQYVSLVSSLNEAYMSFGGLTYFQKHNQVDNLLALHDATRAHRGIGDFWSYHLLSQGKIDIMVEGEVKIWDIAAVSILITEAGGRITDMQGTPLTVHTTSIVATNGLLHKSVLNYFIK